MMLWLESVTLETFTQGSCQLFVRDKHSLESDIAEIPRWWWNLCYIFQSKAITGCSMTCFFKQMIKSVPRYKVLTPYCFYTLTANISPPQMLRGDSWQGNVISLLVNEMFLFCRRWMKGKMSDPLSGFLHSSRRRGSSVSLWEGLLIAARWCVIKQMWRHLLNPICNIWIAVLFF